LDGKTVVVTGEHGRKAAGSVGTVRLDGDRDKKKLAEVRWWSRSVLLPMRMY